MSFGHLREVSIPKIDFIDFDNATAPAIGTSVELETSNFGMNNQRKPNPTFWRCPFSI